nr:cobalt-precorrin-4/precorrin-4 C(11)-methyltransferase [Angustibacter aerolatus]
MQVEHAEPLGGFTVWRPALAVVQARRSQGDHVTVHFVGAGPGAADLLTVRATRLLATSPVCLYAGSLLSDGVLEHCSPGTRLVDTADLTLDQIVAVLVEAHEAGHDVVRLCSGDPSVWSALTEQVRRLRAAGVPYDVTPGVPSFAAAAALLGVEPDRARGRPDRRADPHPGALDRHAGRRAGSPFTPPRGPRSRCTWPCSGSTCWRPSLAEHLGADCPVAVVHRASQPQEPGAARHARHHRRPGARGRGAGRGGGAGGAGARAGRLPRQPPVLGGPAAMTRRR